MFCEVSPELAAESGLTNGGWATIRTARAEIEARVLVTNRIPSLKLNGRVIHQIGMPYHWSSKGLTRGDAANELISFVADPNVSIMETKALTASIEAGRRSKLRRYVTSGSLVSELSNRERDRDLPAARRRPETGHGIKADQTKEGHV